MTPIESKRALRAAMLARRQGLGEGERPHLDLAGRRVDLLGTLSREEIKKTKPSNLIPSP